MPFGRKKRAEDTMLLPHEVLLLACTDPLAGVEGDQRIRTVLSAPGLDWVEVVLTSVRHGVAALLHRRLVSLGREVSIPDEILPILKRIHEAQGARNSAMFAATARIGQALAGEGVPVLALKGVGLALSVYPDHALRDFADIDILVPASEWERAGRIAERVDFAAETAGADLSDYHRSYVMLAQEDILSGCLAPEFDPRHRKDALRDAAHRIVVEIHRSVFNLPGGFSREVDLGPLWNSARVIELPDGTPVQIPGPEMMLVHLAAHAASHRYWRLIFVTDIVQALRSWEAEIDWELLTDLAGRFQCRHAVYRLFEFAGREFGAPVPAAALGRLKPPAGDGPDSKPLEPREIFDAMEIAHMSPSAVIWKRLWCERSPRAAIASWGYLLFPPPSVMRRHYGVQSPFLVAACYFYRPFRLSTRLVHVLYSHAMMKYARSTRTASVVPDIAEPESSVPVEQHPFPGG